jgi:hypothetical protein
MAGKQFSGMLECCSTMILVIFKGLMEMKGISETSALFWTMSRVIIGETTTQGAVTFDTSLHSTVSLQTTPFSSIIWKAKFILITHYHENAERWDRVAWHARASVYRVIENLFLKRSRNHYGWQWRPRSSAKILELSWEWCAYTMSSNEPVSSQRGMSDGQVSQGNETTITVLASASDNLRDQIMPVSSEF